MRNSLVLFDRLFALLRERGSSNVEKKTFVTLEQIQEIAKTYPTPFHLYDEKGIRENVKQLKEAFSWNKGCLLYTSRCV